jgi:hypothetical protein
MRPVRCRGILLEEGAMKRVIPVAAVGVMLFLGGLVTPAWAASAACPNDSVESGTVCIDRYEASVWHVPPSAMNLIRRIKNGNATLANLRRAGAVQLGMAPGDLAANGCPDTGNGCVNVYAVSIPGVMPSRFITWLQAAAAARNSLKRLPTNQEWQVAALGTPDPGSDDDESTTCATSSADVAATGSRSGCVSDVGAFDMVGNVGEWVADWGDFANGCTQWSGSFGSDLSCVGGPGSGASNLPGALHRGGLWFDGTIAGVFAVEANQRPSDSYNSVGFRCAR